MYRSALNLSSRSSVGIQYDMLSSYVGRKVYVLLFELDPTSNNNAVLKKKYTKRIHIFFFQAVSHLRIKKKNLQNDLYKNV